MERKNNLNKFIFYKPSSEIKQHNCIQILDIRSKYFSTKRKCTIYTYMNIQS